MMRRSGRASGECEAYGVSPGVDMRTQYDPRPQQRPVQRFARGIDFDVFTGE